MYVFSKALFSSKTFIVSIGIFLLEIMLNIKNIGDSLFVTQYQTNKLNPKEYIYGKIFKT